MERVSANRVQTDTVLVKKVLAEKVLVRRIRATRVQGKDDETPDNKYLGKCCLKILVKNDTLAIDS